MKPKRKVRRKTKCKKIRIKYKTKRKLTKQRKK